MTRDERIAQADRAGRVAAAMDTLADAAPDGDSPPDYAVRDALDAALADLGGLDGLESFALRFDAQRSRLASVEADRDRLREALRQISDPSGAWLAKSQVTDMMAVAADGLRESEAGS